MNWDCRRWTSPAWPDVGHAVEQVLEHDPDLHAGQVGPEAEVRAAAPEGDVRVGVTADVEGVGVVEDVLVAVGRGVEEDDLVALGDVGPAEGERRTWPCGGSS